METSETERAPRALLVLAWLAAALVALALLASTLTLPSALAPRPIAFEPVLLLVLLLALVRREPRARPLLVVAAVLCWLTTLAAGAEWWSVGLGGGILLTSIGAGAWTEVTSIYGPVSWVPAAVCLLAAVLATVLAVDARRRRGEEPAEPEPDQPDAGPSAPEASAPETSAELERRPAWAADEATGAVWRRAEDAARGDQPDRDWGERRSEEQ